MVFSSIIFLCYFLPLFFLCYYLADARFKNYVVLAFSIFFYSWGAPKFVFLLLASTYLDFYLVKWMYETTEERLKKYLLATSISLNLGLLAFFKYANFFIENVNSLLGFLGSTAIQWTEIILPIGISFYTFQTLTYSIDIYRKAHKPLDKVENYLLYIMMFPQLIAGPIVRFNHIADQINNRKEDWDDRILGFYRFIIGLSKKVLIANVMGAKADQLMGGDLMALDATTAWIGILAYTFQIYFDFSGYSDMAIGIGRMIGFKFPENFDNPYTSQSISEFWRRWHITLGSWMRDYLYIPLGGNRVASTGRMYFNLWFVFLASGLWHGASWNFVLWGAFHGLFLILDRLFLLSFLKKIGTIPAVIFTFFITMLGWVIFRIESFADAMIYYNKLFSFEFSSINIVAEQKFYSILLVAFFFAFFRLIPKIGENWQEQIYFKTYSNTLLIGMFATCSVLFTLSMASILATGFNPFIYFRF